MIAQRNATSPHVGEARMRALHCTTWNKCLPMPAQPAAQSAPLTFRARHPMLSGFVLHFSREHPCSSVSFVPSVLNLVSGILGDGAMSVDEALGIYAEAAQDLSSAG